MRLASWCSAGCRDVGSVRGAFITFEGGEGAGKSTQIRLLGERLRKAGREVVITREPGGSPGAEAVRHVVLDTGAAEPFGTAMEAILFAAARADHVDQVIRPGVLADRIVLCDRFMDSTRVYQGATGRLDPVFLRALERVAIAGMRPDLTILLDLDPREGMLRALARRGKGAPDRFEKESLDKHRKRRLAFLDLAAREPDRFRIVDAARTPEEIADEIEAHVARFLKRLERRSRDEAAGEPFAARQDMAARA